MPNHTYINPVGIGMFEVFCGLSKDTESYSDLVKQYTSYLASIHKTVTENDPNNSKLLSQVKLFIDLARCDIIAYMGEISIIKNELECSRNAVSVFIPIDSIPTINEYAKENEHLRVLSIDAMSEIKFRQQEKYTKTFDTVGRQIIKTAHFENYDNVSGLFYPIEAVASLPKLCEEITSKYAAVHIVDIQLGKNRVEWFLRQYLDIIKGNSSNKKT